MANAVKVFHSINSKKADGNVSGLHLLVAPDCFQMDTSIRSAPFPTIFVSSSTLINYLTQSDRSSKHHPRSHLWRPLHIKSSSKKRGFDRFRWNGDRPAILRLAERSPLEKMVASDLNLYFDPICCVECWVVWVSRKPWGDVCRTHGVSFLDWDWNWVSGAAH